MRIVQVSTLYPPELFSGGTLAPHHIALSLQRRGHDVSVYSGSCLYGEPPLAERSWVFEGIPVHAINVMPGYAQGVPNYRNAAVAERFDRYLATAQPDVVHFHCIQALGADILAVPRAHGAATLLTMHDGWFACSRQFMYTDAPLHRMCPLKVDPAACDCTAGFDFVERRRFLERSLERVDRVLAVSQPFLEVLRENGVAADKLLVCENGLAPASPLPHTRSDRVRFGHLAGPEGWKGARTLAKALQLLDRDVLIHLHGIDAEAWKALGGTWPDPRVRMRSRFGPAELPAIMAGLDVVLVTSIGMETFSLVTREAMQHGVPVISSRCLGPEGIVRDGENGLLYDRDDAEGLAAAMRRMASDPEFCARAGAAAAATPIRTIEEQVSQVEEIYREITRPRPKAGREPPLPRSVLFIAGMDGAPFRYRVTNLVEQLEALGVRVAARFHRDEESLALAGEHEIVILNRVHWDDYTERIVARARAAGALLVFAVDDLIFDPELDIPALKGLPPKTSRAYRRGLKLFHRTFAACDAFLGSTEALAEAARRMGKPAFVHPNTLGRELASISDEARLRAAAGRERGLHPVVRIGYFSGSYAHDCDFAVAAGALASVLGDRAEVQLVLGGHLEVPEVLAPFGDRIERLPFVSWRELPALLARVDVCVAPLELPSVFNDAKSALKWFEAAAAGVPTIASPTKPFQDAIRHGENGMLAHTEADWAAALRALVDDRLLRNRLAEAARADALERHGAATALPLLVRTMRELHKLSRGPLRVVPGVAAELSELRARGIGVGRAAMEPRDALPGPCQLSAADVTPRMGGRASIHQPFFPPDGTLFRIDLLVGTYGRVHRHDLVLRLVDLASGDEMARSVVPAEHACDNSWLAFETGEVPTRAGQELLILLEAPAAAKGKGLSVYCEFVGWPTGAGWCGSVHGFSLTYRTWYRHRDRPSPEQPPAAGATALADALDRANVRARSLEARLAVAQERSTRSQGSRLQHIARGTRAWRTAERLLASLEGGPSLPNRALRNGVALLRPNDPEQVERLVNRVRSTLPYRAARWVYRRSVRRR
jgi:glycosyltransferase involved in cell wall biosynthesis